MWRWLSLTPTAVLPNMRELVFQKSFSANNVCTAFKGRWGENTVQRRRWQDYREENYLFSLYRHKSLFLMNSWMWQLNSCLDVMLLDAHLKFWGREKTQIIWVWNMLGSFLTLATIFKILLHGCLTGSTFNEVSAISFCWTTYVSDWLQELSIRLKINFAFVRSWSVSHSICHSAV